jgi:hypothetical protein
MFAAGATDTHDHIWKNPSAGKHKLEFIADFDKQKSESNENNNRFTLTFTADNCATGSKSEIDYFALGDSVASGHGLAGATGECFRSNKAYPYTVRDALKMRYQKVNFPTHKAADGSVVRHHLACSGDKVGNLINQVNYVRDHLSADHPTLV